MLFSIASSNAAGDSDRLLLDNGDELAGFFEGIADDAVTFKTDAGSVPIKIDRITAILFNPALRRKPPSRPIRSASGPASATAAACWPPN